MADDETEHLTTTEARAASSSKDTRNILVWGLILVIVIFGIILFVAR